ncbi:MAG: EamA family transporter [Elusimicrobia bacterium]|nr:EamA family transporter [Elusimicrobiota bacterium]
MKVFFLYSLICLIWGSTWLAIKIGLEGVPPFLAAGLRFVLASAVLFLIVFLKHIKIRLSEEGKISVLSAGILGFTLNYVGVYWAEQYISSGLAAILFSTMPLVVSLLSHFWMRSESLTNRKVTGILIGIAGTTVLFWPSEQVSLIKMAAMLAVLGAVLVSSINLLILKRYSRQTNMYLLNALGMSIGAISLLALSFVMESYDHLAWSRSNVLAILYLAVFGSVVTFLSYYYLLHAISATALSLSTLIIPVVAVLLGWIFYAEEISSHAIMGIVLVLSGVGLASVSGPIRVRFWLGRGGG